MARWARSTWRFLADLSLAHWIWTVGAAFMTMAIVAVWGVSQRIPGPILLCLVIAVAAAIVLLMNGVAEYHRRRAAPSKALMKLTRLLTDLDGVILLLRRGYKPIARRMSIFSPNVIARGPRGPTRI